MTKRNCQGSVIVLTVFATMFVALLLLGICTVSIYALKRYKATTACEAGALASAKDLARIVINDEHYGYVALTDWPSGKQTVNAAGEPMPVRGINSIVSTCRYDMLIATRLQNQTMIALAEEDRRFAVEAAAKLQRACLDSLSPRIRQKPEDKDGNVVDAFSTGRRAFMAAMPPGKMNLQSFSIELGKLTNPCSSMAPLPQPLSESDTAGHFRVAECYAAFVDVPLGGTNFTFAGLGRTTSLIQSAGFRLGDKNSICSAVRVVASIDSGLKMFEPAGTQEGWLAKVDACALPGANPDLIPPAVLITNFPHGLPAQLTCLQDMIADRALATHPVNLLRASDGDFPNDGVAQLIDDNSVGGSHSLPARDLIARSLYDWLRTCHAKPRIDSLLQAFSMKFSDLQVGNAGQSLAYGMDNHGNVFVLPQRCYSTQTILDGQSYAVDYELVLGNRRWTLSCRDQVHRLGKEGGKHAGRPLLDTQVLTEIERVYPHDGLAVALEFSSPQAL